MNFLYLFNIDILLYQSVILISNLTLRRMKVIKLSNKGVNTSLLEYLMNYTNRNLTITGKESLKTMASKHNMTPEEYVKNLFTKAISNGIKEGGEKCQMKE